MAAGPVPRCPDRVRNRSNWQRLLFVRVGLFGPPPPPQFSFGENWRPADLLFLDCSLLSQLPVNLPDEGASQGFPRPGKRRAEGCSANNRLLLHQSQGIFASPPHSCGVQARGIHGLCSPPMPVFV